MLTTPMTTPGCAMSTSKMPGHWLLARMGKRVLRPGGIELTTRLLELLNIDTGDDVVEFAPGLGLTAQRTLARGPNSYTAVERDIDAAALVRAGMSDPSQQCIVGDAADTGLADECASVVYGEAMLTMQSHTQKSRIVAEAARLLRRGGRYGIHEIAIVPDDADDQIVKSLEHDLSHVIHHGVRPLTMTEWRRLFGLHGLSASYVALAPMHLLEPRRLVRDEGIGRALRFAWNVLTTPEARRRVLAMRRVFRKYEEHLRAVVLIGEKS